MVPKRCQRVATVSKCIKEGARRWRGRAKRDPELLVIIKRMNTKVL